MTPHIDIREEELLYLTELFRAIGDFTRLRLLLRLIDREACVTELTKELGMTQSAVSHQLSILKSHRLVTSRRAGKQVYYSRTKETDLALQIIQAHQTYRPDNPHRKSKTYHAASNNQQ